MSVHSRMLGSASAQIDNHPCKFQYETSYSECKPAAGLDSWSSDPLLLRHVRVPAHRGHWGPWGQARRFHRARTSLKHMTCNASSHMTTRTAACYGQDVLRSPDNSTSVIAPPTKAAARCVVCRHASARRNFGNPCSKCN
eukprot:6190753-Amphidinium_carterae.1